MKYRYSYNFGGKVIVRMDENGKEEFICRKNKQWAPVRLKDEDLGICFDLSQEIDEVTAKAMIEKL